MSQTPFSLAGFQVITIGRFWVIAEAYVHVTGAEVVEVHDLESISRKIPNCQLRGFSDE